jgi:ribonuclease Z
MLLAAGIAYARRDAIQMALFKRAAERAVSRDTLATLDPKALHVAFCGTGSPLPSRDRAGACTAVIASGRVFVFDSGEGSAEVLAGMGIVSDRIVGVWLTHLHSDHFEGLGPLMLQRWAGTSAKTPLLVHGPIGVDVVTRGLTDAYRIDASYRIAHHGEAIVPRAGFGLTAQVITPGIVYDQGGVRITAFPVDHTPVSPAFGYRVDWQGKSVTISGDTATSPSLVTAAKGTDLLVHEVLSARLIKAIGTATAKAGKPGRAKIMTDIQTYHSTPELAASVAKASGAKALAMSHVVPAVPGFLNGLFERPAQAGFAGPIWLMRDGDLVSIDADGPHKPRNLLD